MIAEVKKLKKKELKSNNFQEDRSLYVIDR